MTRHSSYLLYKDYIWLLMLMANTNFNSINGPSEVDGTTQCIGKHEQGYSSSPSKTKKATISFQRVKSSCTQKSKFPPTQMEFSLSKEAGSG